MKKFKMGDRVRTIGQSAGNSFFGEGTVVSISNTRISVSADNGSGNWSVAPGDLEFINQEAQIAFAKRFLNKDGIKLFESEYLEVSIKPSQKMKDEMELVAVDAFLETVKEK